MSFGGFDPEIIQDFLTESGELLEQLEADLVTLESSPSDLGLLNQIFRALHTIKGSASFLALTNLVSIAHAAESALNAARNGQVVVDRVAMDLLLESTDLLRRQFGQLTAGEDLDAPPQRLVDTLTRIGEGVAPAEAAGTASSATAAAASSPSAASAPAADSRGPDGAESLPFSLDPAKADLVEYLVADLNEALDGAQERIGRLADEQQRVEAARELAELADNLVRTVEFFEFQQMGELARALNEAADAIASLDDDQRSLIIPRLEGVLELLRRQGEGITKNTEYRWSIAGLLESIRAAMGEGEPCQPAESARDALVIAGVYTDAPSPAAGPASLPFQAAPTVATTAESKPNPAPHADGAEAGGKPAKQQRTAAAVEQTIRVEVGRLEALMNLVGELVLQKNRVSALSRQVGGLHGLDQDTRESVLTSASELDRVTSDIQLAVMRTRMQPLDKVFGRYPRLIRDLAAKTGKKIDLVIEGGDTEVDKSVIEELGDPLVHLMRNSADHGLEKPEERLASGKGEIGMIKLAATHNGGHVEIRVIDDGRGLPRDRIGKKAIEKGLTTEQELSHLSDADVFRFIFEAGFSTADQVSDLSGRGVGMDVVRTNIEKLKGTIAVDSAPGKGTTFTITIPLTVAIMQAMMVGVDGEIYAIPLANILEIVRPEEEQIASIGAQPVLRVREAVLPMLDAREVFDCPGFAVGSEKPRVAVILHAGGRQVAMLVNRVIGQQEIVIKPLDSIERAGPLSGATVRDDGGVSLIVDVAQLVKLGECGLSAAA